MTIVNLSDHRQAAAPRPLPTNVDLEQAVLGAILLDNGLVHGACSRLEAEHFSEEIHRRIFDVAASLIREGRVASPVTLASWFNSVEPALGKPTALYLGGLAAEAPAPAMVPDYARAVTDLRVRRQLIAAAQEMQEQAYNPPASVPVDRLLDGAEERLADLRARTVTTSANTRVTAGAAADELLAQIDRIRAGEEKGTGVTTGISDLDFDTGGLRGGDLWVIAGRVSMGKSIKGITLARAAAKSGAGVLLFPFEIGRRQAIARVLSDLAYYHRRPLGYGQILKGEVDDEDLWRLQDARKRLSEMPLVFDDAPRATLAQIASRARSERDRMAKQGIKLGVVVLDYLNFIKAGDRYAGQRHAEIGEISIGLKQLAKTLDVCVVLLAQVNRQTEHRDDKRPQLSDLRESGSLESDADVVVLLFREAYYIERSAAYLGGDAEATAKAVEAKHQIDVIVSKNRIGATKNYKLWCDVSCSTIAAYARGGL